MDMIVTFPGGKRVDAQYKGFTIRTDQSLLDGGDASASAPFNLFLASIATCAGINVLEFAEDVITYLFFNQGTKQTFLKGGWR
jgi:putative redox protein